MKSQTCSSRSRISLRMVPVSSMVWINWLQFYKRFKKKKKKNPHCFKNHVDKRTDEMNFNQLEGDVLRAEQRGICRTSGQIRLSWHPVMKSNRMRRRHSVLCFRRSGKETPHVLLLLQTHLDGTLVYKTVCYFLFILLLKTIYYILRFYNFTLFLFAVLFAFLSLYICTLYFKFFSVRRPQVS